MSLQTLRWNELKSTIEQQKLTGWMIALAITTVTLLIFHIWTLHTFPLTHVDEGWFANRAAGYLSSGVPFGTMDSGVFDRLPEPWLIFPVIPTILQAFVLNVVGGVDLTALRLLSLVSGAALLYVVYRIGTWAAGRWSGLVAVALVGVSLPFAFSSHIARHDILAATAAWVAICLFFIGRRRWMDIAAGILIGVAMEIHPNAAILGLALVVLALLEKGDRGKRLMAVAGGGFIGIAGFVALHILPNPDSYLELNKIAFAESHVPPLFSGSLEVIAESFIQKTLLLKYLYPVIGGASWLLALAGMVGVVILLQKGDEKEQRVAQMAIVVLMAFGLLVSNNQVYYIIMMAPAIGLVLAVGGARLFRLRNDTTWRLGFLTVATVVFVSAALPALSLVASFRNDFEPVSAAVVSTIKPGEIVMGAQKYWMAAPATDWRSWESLVYHRRMVPGSTVGEAFMELDPDVLVVDSQIRAFVVEDGSERGGLIEALALPADEFDEVLARGTLAATVDDGSANGIQIYRFP